MAVTKGKTNKAKPWTQAGDARHEKELADSQPTESRSGMTDQPSALDPSAYSCPKARSLLQTSSSRAMRGDPRDGRTGRRREVATGKAILFSAGAPAACARTIASTPPGVPEVVPVAVPPVASASSSTRNMTSFVCPELDPTSHQNLACGSCVSSRCNSQMAAGFGINWASEGFRGGRCEDFVNCIGRCNCGEQVACVRNCGAFASSDCKEAQL